jgi:TfoX/Sxy family transcriptional regulator of competence genes
VSTSKATIAYLLEQLEPLDVRARAMFGEYGIYVGEKITAFVCDDTVFLKPTPASAGMPEAPAYPGAKPSRVVSGDLIEDADALRALFAATADALPVPKPRKHKR